MTKQFGRVLVVFATSEKCNDRPGEYRLRGCVLVSWISTVIEKMKLSWLKWDLGFRLKCFLTYVAHFGLLLHGVKR